MEVTIKLVVNGVDHTVTTDPRRRLLEVLREDLQLTGTKYGCGEGQCGACLVLMDGRPTKTCLVTARTAEGKNLRTIEGLEKDDTLHVVQEAFLEEGAMQCGYCTSGMIMAAVALLEKNREPSDHEIVGDMNGNICRCNEYVRILRAVRRAGLKLKEKG